MAYFEKHEEDEKEEHELHVSELTWKTFEQVAALLAPFQYIMTLLQGEAYSTTA